MNIYFVRATHNESCTPPNVDLTQKQNWNETLTTAGLARS
jgi:hypothetical protein